jgi:hypothetical protein
MSAETSFGRIATPFEKAANERALARLFELFPRLPKRDVGDFLLNCSAYPFADIPYLVHKQLSELSRRCHKDVTRAYRLSFKEYSLRPSRKERFPKP